MSNSATNILSLFLVSLLSNRLNPAGAGGANMVGVGAIGMASVFSTQVNEFLRSLTQPFTQYVVFPLMKKAGSIFSRTAVPFRDETSLPTVTFGDLTEKVYIYFQKFFDTAGTKKDLWHPRDAGSSQIKISSHKRCLTIVLSRSYH
ncbi:MAG: hypothetical protein KA436_05670 [Oligoflexales bacterium]|nr:hypothetical protein [Oligoflexales bacterium]